MIGAGEPALPGIWIGHNGKIAFGLTIFNVDQEDLYVYELDPADPHQYRYATAGSSMHVVHESVEVKGQAARDVELEFTRHGPVVYVDEANKRAFAIRSVWLRTGHLGLFRLVRLYDGKGLGRFRHRDEALGRAVESRIMPTSKAISAGFPAPKRRAASTIG